MGDVSRHGGMFMASAIAAFMVLGVVLIADGAVEGSRWTMVAGSAIIGIAEGLR